ncbi:phosphorylase-like protein 8 [Elsinoe australis]|uniref:Phosphorylase-like protein 8 n=1 Tax=Elsinoe australis TaxID=40998 RepID=A0A4U7AN08_9PEZI|nr:phosphorylase-like protein 8 [Elsinoe australis]
MVEILTSSNEPRDKSLYTVGIICALPIELAAIIAVLDEQHDSLESDPGDDNAYTYGRIGQHEVIIACLPAGQYATISTSVVAEHMLKSFSHSLRVGLLVGIGGGVPSSRCNIKLGDVAVSQPDGTSGGVVQYDLGKMHENGFERRGHLNSPPKVLLTTLAKLQAQHVWQEPQFHRYMEQVQRSSSKAQKVFARPDAVSDFSRQPQTSMSDNESPDVPEVYYGTIASGNVVMKDAAQRDRIAKSLGDAICFEMEAAGLMQTFPCLVIRGISDIADIQKNDDWHAYAALSAAAFAKEYLSYLPAAAVSHITLARDVMEGVQSGVQSIREFNSRQEERQHAAAYNSLVDQLLRSTVLSDRVRETLPERLGMIGGWVLDSDTFRDWWNSSHNIDLLWITANPGCGKSVLAKSLANAFREEPLEHAAIAQFFFGPDENSSFDELLRSLLHFELEIMQRPRAQFHAELLIKNGLAASPPSANLQKALTECFSDKSCGDRIIFIDAIDECKYADQTRLFEWIDDLLNSKLLDSTHTIKFCFFSRPYINLEDGFSRISDRVPIRRIRGENSLPQIDEDVRQFIIARTASSNSSAKYAVQDALLSNTHYSYLCPLAVLESENPAKYRFLEIVDGIPPALGSRFECILKKVKNENRPYADLVFNIMLGMDRPLRAWELWLTFCCLSDSETNVRQIYRATSFDQEAVVRCVRDWCGLFVVYQDDQFQFAEQGAKMFLQSSFLRRYYGSQTSGREWRYSVDYWARDINLWQVGIVLLQDRHFADSLVKMTDDLDLDSEHLADLQRLFGTEGVSNVFSSVSTTDLVAYLKCVRSTLARLASRDSLGIYRMIAYPSTFYLCARIFHIAPIGIMVHLSMGIIFDVRLANIQHRLGSQFMWAAALGGAPKILYDYWSDPPSKTAVVVLLMILTSYCVLNQRVWTMLISAALYPCSARRRAYFQTLFQSALVNVYLMYMHLQMTKLHIASSVALITDGCFLAARNLLRSLRESG